MDNYNIIHIILNGIKEYFPNIFPNIKTNFNNPNNTTTTNNIHRRIDNGNKCILDEDFAEENSTEEKEKISYINKGNENEETNILINFGLISPPNESIEILPNEKKLKENKEKSNEKENKAKFIVNKNKSFKQKAPKKKKKFLVNKRDKRVRFDNSRTMLARDILNTYYLPKINKILIGKNFKFKLKKFPKIFTNTIIHKNKKNNLDSPLEDFYNDENLEYNKKIIDEIKKDKYKDFREKSGLEKELKKTFRDLIEEYLEKNEYQKKIETMKGKDEKFDVETFINSAKDFIENYN